MAMSAEYRSKYEALNYDDVSIRMKNSRVGRKTPKKETNKIYKYGFRFEYQIPIVQKGTYWYISFLRWENEWKNVKSLLRF